MSSSGNDPDTWDGRWIARLSQDSAKAGVSSSSNAALTLAHGTLAIATGFASDGFLLILAISCCAVAIVWRLVVPFVRRRRAAARERPAIDPFGR